MSGREVMPGREDRDASVAKKAAGAGVAPINGHGCWPDEGATRERSAKEGR